MRIFDFAGVEISDSLLLRGSESFVLFIECCVEFIGGAFVEGGVEDDILVLISQFAVKEVLFEGSHTARCSLFDILRFYKGRNYFISCWK